MSDTVSSARDVVTISDNDVTSDVVKTAVAGPYNDVASSLILPCDGGAITFDVAAESRDEVNPFLVI